MEGSVANMTGGKSNHPRTIPESIPDSYDGVMFNVDRINNFLGTDAVAVAVFDNKEQLDSLMKQIGESGQPLQALNIMTHGGGIGANGDTHMSVPGSTSSQMPEPDRLSHGDFKKMIRANNTKLESKPKANEPIITQCKAGDASNVPNGILEVQKAISATGAGLPVLPVKRTVTVLKEAR
jgi:hypothetical protein